MTEQEERRRYTRIEFDGNAAVEQDDKSFPVHLIDISLNGVLIETPDDYAIKADQAVNITINLTGETFIAMTAKLVHSSNHMLGFHCESIDMESMTHLRRLIELNMEDPKASERVLDELLMPQ